MNNKQGKQEDHDSSSSDEGDFASAWERCELVDHPQEKCTDENNKTQIGKDTKNSIQSGILEGFIFEINGQIEKFKRKIPNLKVILTGGDAKYLYKRIKNSIFAEQEFLASGLNNLLKCNKL